MQKSHFPKITTTTTSSSWLCFLKDIFSPHKSIQIIRLYLKNKNGVIVNIFPPAPFFFSHDSTFDRLIRKGLILFQAGLELHLYSQSICGPALITECKHHVESMPYCFHKSTCNDKSKHSAQGPGCSRKHLLHLPDSFEVKCLSYMFILF